MTGQALYPLPVWFQMFVIGVVMLMISAGCFVIAFRVEKQYQTLATLIWLALGIGALTAFVA